MIKRSLLCVLTAYSLGIILHDRPGATLWAVLLFCLFFLGFCVRKQKWICFQKPEKFFLLSLLFVFFIGAYAAKRQTAAYPLDAVLTEKQPGLLSGCIQSIRETAKGYQLRIACTKLMLPSDGKNFAGEEAIEKESFADEASDRSNVAREVVLDELVFSKGTVLVWVESTEGLCIGNEVRIQGDVLPLSEAENKGQFDEKQFYRADGISCKMNAESITILSYEKNEFKEWCRSIRLRLDSIYESVLPTKQAGVISAILLGERAGIEEETKELYQRNGIAHILAISGLHVSLVGMGLFAFLRRCGGPIIPAALVTVLVLIFYGFLTEFSVSTQRAVGMLIFAMLARILGRTYDSRSACSFCALFILFCKPLMLYQAGFQLSFVTAFGISYFQTELCRMKLNRGRRLREKVIVMLVSGATTQLLTAPILLNFYYELPMYSVFLNLPVIGLLSTLVLLSLVVGVVGIFSLSLGKFLAGGVYIILEVYELFCKVAEHLPFPVLLYGKPESVRIHLYYLILAVFFFVAKLVAKWYRKDSMKRKHSLREHQYRRFAFLILCLLPLPLIRFPQAETQIDFLSVGQGDCAVVQSTSGKHYMIDCGSLTVNSVGKYRLEPYLKYHGIAALDAVFLTHPDADHINGAKELLEKTNSPTDCYRGRIQIRNLILAEAFREEVEQYRQAGIDREEESAIRELSEIVSIAEEKGIPIRYFSPGDEVYDAGLRAICLHPSVDYETKDFNDASLVLLLDLGNAVALFPGDVGARGEERVLSQLELYTESLYKTNRILKVAHHGSKNSSSMELLTCFQPSISVISCARNNRFGHPHTEVLDRLMNVGSKIMRTDENGAVQFNLGVNETSLSCDTE